jgi:hypothetical protein
MKAAPRRKIESVPPPAPPAPTGSPGDGTGDAPDPSEATPGSLAFGASEPVGSTAVEGSTVGPALGSGVAVLGAALDRGVVVGYGAVGGRGVAVVSKMTPTLPPEKPL